MFLQTGDLKTGKMVHDWWHSTYGMNDVHGSVATFFANYTLKFDYLDA